MTPSSQVIDALEGRLLAHRRLLVQLLARLPPTTGENLIDWLAERTLPQDGQEDPGAVPTEGMGLELAMADEYRQLAQLTRDLRARD